MITPLPQIVVPIQHQVVTEEIKPFITDTLTTIEMLDGRIAFIPISTLNMLVKQNPNNVSWVAVKFPYMDVIISGTAQLEFPGPDKLVRLRDLPENSHITIGYVDSQFAETFEVTIGKLTAAAAKAENDSEDGRSTMLACRIKINQRVLPHKRENKFMCDLNRITAIELDAIRQACNSPEEDRAEWAGPVPPTADDRCLWGGAKVKIKCLRSEIEKLTYDSYRNALDKEIDGSFITAKENLHLSVPAHTSKKQKWITLSNRPMIGADIHFGYKMRVWSASRRDWFYHRNFESGKMEGERSFRDEQCYRDWKQKQPLQPTPQEVKDAVQAFMDET